MVVKVATLEVSALLEILAFVSPKVSAPPNVCVPPVMATVPLSMSVVPENVFTPDSVKIPVLSLVKPPLPPPNAPSVVGPLPSTVSGFAPLVTAPSEMPPTLVSRIVVAPVSVTAPVPWPSVALLLNTAPPLEIPVPPIVSGSAPIFVPFKSSAAPLVTTVPAAELPSAEALPNFNVPAETVVTPVCALAPFNVSGPVPVLVTVVTFVPMMPPMVKPLAETALNVRSNALPPLIAPSVKSPALAGLLMDVPALASVIAPVFVAGLVLLLSSAPAAAMPVPPIVTGIADVKTCPPKSSTAPLDTVTPLLVPNAVVLPHFNVPDAMAVVPE